MEQICCIMFVYLSFIMSLWRATITYDLKCPENKEWELRATSKCKGTDAYFCLYNNVRYHYKEGCEGPKAEGKGNKKVFVKDFSRARCDEERFQPFKFSTTEASKCVYEKSFCNDFGQIVSSNGSWLDDRTCTCDTYNGFDYVANKSGDQICLPVKEDCSCFYPGKFVDIIEKTAMNKSQMENSSGKGQSQWIENTSYKEPKTGQLSFFWKGNIVISNKRNCMIFVGVVTVLVILVAIVFLVPTQIPICPAVRDFVYQNEGIFSKEELNYLILVYIIYRVACPVVRIVFNSKLNEQTLAEQLNRNKKRMKNRLSITFCPEQNNLLWPSIQGELHSSVSSSKFDIRLMICLLNSLTSLNIPDRQPFETDRSISEMLARIKFTRNVVTMSVDGTVSDKEFEQSCIHTFQAIYELIPPHFEHIDENRGNYLQVIGCLSNYLRMDKKTVKSFNRLVMVNTVESLKKVITEFCVSNGKSITEILETERHNLCHKRKKQLSCCECNLSTYKKHISETHWKRLFTDNNQCTCQVPNECSKRFIANSCLSIDSCDISLLKCLIFNVPRLSKYALSRMCRNDFKSFLKLYKHQLYHAFVDEKCCKCQDNYLRSSKSFHSLKDWNFLFEKVRNLNIFSSCNGNCCCLFKPKANIDIDSLEDEDDLLYKLMRIAEPVSIWKDTETVTVEDYLGFRNTIDKATKNIMEVVENTQLMDEREEKLTDSLRWANSHTLNSGKKEKGLVEVFNMLYNSSTDKPSDHKEQRVIDRCLLFSLTSGFGPLLDITYEENNFLLIFYLLQQVVCPAVRAEFDRHLNLHCKSDVLNKVLNDIQDEEHKNYIRIGNDRARRRSRSKVTNQIPENLNENEREKTIMKYKPEGRPLYLSKIHRDRLFPDNGEISSQNMDLKLMILILRRIIDKNKTTEDSEKNSHVLEHLKRIDSVRSRMTQSSSGTIAKTEFLKMHNILYMAVNGLEGNHYNHYFEITRDIKNVFDKSCHQKT